MEVNNTSGLYSGSPFHHNSFPSTQTRPFFLFYTKMDSSIDIKSTMELLSFGQNSTQDAFISDFSMNSILRQSSQGGMVPLKH